MSNEYVGVLHSHDYYKGKSIDFAGTWTSGVRYFNDEYITNFVVYAEKDSEGNVLSSALLACKKTHMSKKNGAIKNREDNEPNLIVNDGSVIGISPNDFWIFICGSIRGLPGESAEIVETYADALKLATSLNLGKLVYVKNPEGLYTVTGAGILTSVVIGNEVEKLQKEKVDKVDGKQLSTEDYTTEEKNKLSNIEDGAQANIIEGITINGSKVPVANKSASISIKVNTYTVEKLATPEGNNYASYVLRENGARIGSVINIPKDKSVNGGSIEEVVRNGYPYSGAVAGDKYIDLVLNDTAKTHVYIPAQKLVDIYSGSKYIDVDSKSKTISLDYDNLKSDLNESVKIKVAQVDGLSDRLSTLESSTSKVVSIGTSTRPLVGTVKLDNRDFSIDTTTNTISLNFNSEDFDTSGMADRVREELLGKKSDVLDYDENSTVGLSLYGVKNAIINLSENTLTSDNIGKGLSWDSNKLNLKTINGSAVQTDKDGNVILTWS